MSVIRVDADACPVKGEIERVATRHRLPVELVCDGGLRPSANPLVTVVYVTGDIVLTNDLPLADRALAAGARVLTFAGEELTTRNIAARLAARNAADAARAEMPLGMAGGGGGRAFSRADRARFSNALERMVRGR